MILPFIIKRVKRLSIILVGIFVGIICLCFTTTVNAQVAGKNVSFVTTTNGLIFTSLGQDVWVELDRNKNVVSYYNEIDRQKEEGFFVHLKTHKPISKSVFLDLDLKKISVNGSPAYDIASAEDIRKQKYIAKLLLHHNFYSYKVNLSIREGIFFGALGIQFLFFFLLFLIERDTIHFYFSLIALGCLIALSTDWSSQNFILSPTIKKWQIPTHFFGLFVLGTGFLKFTDNYFNYHNRGIISRRWIPALLLFWALFTIIAIIDSSTYFINISLTFLGVSVLFSLYLAVVAPTQKESSKRFYFLAFIPAAICAFLLIILTIVFNFSDLSNELYHLIFEQLFNIVKICTAALLTLLALSVGYRTNILKADQKLAIELAEKNSTIEAKNAQNELLLKEIHHRVKNNLEVVSSLLELQSAQTKDAEAQSVMKASQSRVQSMGIIHQKLYQGENLASIEMKDYFKNLCESILDTYEAWDDVSIEYDMDEIELDVDTAVPIGLIVNELLTNALKYAFPDGEKGHIRLHLEELANRKLQLVVEDDGIGKDKNAKIQGTGFGSQLVNLLTRQLNGSMREEIVNGTRFEFEFEFKPNLL